MRENNDTGFTTSETPFTSPYLPRDEYLSNSLQNLCLGDLGLVENNQKGDERDRSSNGVSSTNFQGDHSSSSNGTVSARDGAIARAGIPQREGWGVQERDIGRAYSVQRAMVNGNGMRGSVYPSNLIGLSDGHGVGLATSDVVSQLELVGAQERGIWTTASVGNPGVESDPERFPHWQRNWGLRNGWIGRDDTATESFMHGLGQDSLRLNDGFNGSSSIRSMQSPDHLSGGLSFNGSQPTRTPVAEEYSNAGNTAQYFEGTDEPLPEVVLQNYSRLQMVDLSLLEELNDRDIQIIAVNPLGCNYLHRILAWGDAFAIEKILSGTLEVVFEVMSDQFGNLLFQRLVESCNEDQIERIIAIVTGCKDLLITVANTKSGIRSILKLSKIVKNSAPLVLRLTFALIPGLRALMTNPYGCHAIRYLLQIQGCHYPLLYEAIIGNCLALATDERGCLSLNNSIDNSRPPFREQLLALISDNAVFLSQDPYGNFVVQHVLLFEVPYITRNICHNLEGYYVRLSMQKSSSHVVEKCLRSSERDCIIWELVDSGKLDQLARNQFGNYVVQTALKMSKGRLRDILVKAIMRDARSLMCNPYGKIVIKFISSRYRPH